MTSVAYPYLLTVAIPTYNRASDLDLCLSQITGQLKGHEGEMELLVSDNCSTDTTGEVVRKYLSLGYPVTYLKNSENIGPDRNFLQCFRKAQGKYLLIMGDDDVLLDGALDELLPILRGGDYGIVFLNSYGFTGDFVRERPPGRASGHAVYTDTASFLKEGRPLLHVHIHERDQPGPRRRAYRLATFLRLQSRPARLDLVRPVQWQAACLRVRVSGGSASLQLRRLRGLQGFRTQFQHDF